MTTALHLVKPEPEEGAERTDSGLVVPEGAAPARRPTVLDLVLRLAIRDEREVPCGFITFRVHPWFVSNMTRMAALVGGLSVPPGWQVGAGVVATDCPRRP